MWHVTLDTWHVTRCDTWHNRGGEHSLKNFSSLALTVCDLWCYEDLEKKDDWLNEWINDQAVHRTAPATLGLLKIFQFWVPSSKMSQTMCKWRLKIQIFFLNRSGKFPAGVRVRTPNYPYMDICGQPFLLNGNTHHHKNITVERRCPTIRYSYRQLVDSAICMMGSGVPRILWVLPKSPSVVFSFCT